MTETQKVSAQEIALEIEKLKEDSARDVQRQLAQQHVAESETRIEEEIRQASDRVLSPTGEAVEAKAAPALSLAEHLTEGVVNDSAADIEDLQEELHALRKRLASRIGNIEDEQSEEIARLEAEIREKERSVFRGREEARGTHP